jgi:putative salt-induced outer membrane protein YdiY
VFKTRFGAGLRETFTSKYPIYADDPETAEVETTLFQGILESVSDLTWTIDSNVVFTSRLELLAPFETLDQITVRSDNILAAKISEYFTAKINVELLNDWRVTRKTQVRETIALGFSYALL